MLRTLGKSLLSDPIPHRPLSSSLPEASFLEESVPVTPMSYSHTTKSLDDDNTQDWEKDADAVTTKETAAIHH